MIRPQKGFKPETIEALSKEKPKDGVLMFRTGKISQQKSLFDQDLSFSPAMQKMLQKSWAGNFFGTLFLAIQEDRFSVLYSEKISRPNKPINLLVSLLY